MNEHLKPFPVDNLLDPDSREKLPSVNSSCEELRLLTDEFVKNYSPDSGWTWYSSDFDEGDIFIGSVDDDKTELGYFSLSELESERGQLGLSIERDLHFSPTRKR